MQAAAWLVNISCLYHEQGITLDQTWMANIEQETISDNNSNEARDTLDSSDNPDSPEDDWSKDEAEMPACHYQKSKTF